ncbi:WD40/YVTN repeat-like containing protein [Gracilaria domingensis]|nr:WD40/YVTN repeat-like containing protein [Gracilaria domingensis]
MKVFSIDLDKTGEHILTAGFLPAGVDPEGLHGGAVAIYKYPSRGIATQDIEHGPLDWNTFGMAPIRCFRFAEDSKRFFTGHHKEFGVPHDDGLLTEWDSECFQPISAYYFDGASARGLEVSHAPGAYQGFMCAVLEESKDLVCIDTRSCNGQTVQSFFVKGHDFPVRSAEWAPSNPFLLASCDATGQACLFDIRRSGLDACLLKFDPLRRLGIENRQAIIHPGEGYRFSKRQCQSPNYQRNFKAPLLGLGRAWTPEYSVPAQSHDTECDYRFSSAPEIHFSVDGTEVVTAGPATSFRVWDVITGRLVSEGFDLSIYRPPVMPHMQMAPDGVHMIWHVGSDSNLQLMDIEKGKVVDIAEGRDGRFYGNVKVHPLENEVVSAHKRNLNIWTF